MFSHNVCSDPIDVHKQTSAAEPKSMKKKKSKPKARCHLKRVSLDFAVQLHDIDITNIIPDQKLCYDCRTSLTNKLKNAELNIQNQNSDSQHSISLQASYASQASQASHASMHSNYSQASAADLELSRNDAREQIDSTLEKFGVSPLKSFHGINKLQKPNLIKDKVQKLQEPLKKTLLMHSMWTSLR